MSKHNKTEGKLKKESEAVASQYYIKKVSPKLLSIKRKRIQFLKKKAFNYKEFRNRAIAELVRDQNDQ